MQSAAPTPAVRPATLELRTRPVPSDWRHDAQDQPTEQASNEHQQSEQGSQARTAAEWVTLGISSLIVVGLFALVTYFHLTASSDPVIVEVQPRATETYQAGGRFYLPITVHNRGGETGEEVKVRVTLTSTDGHQETAELQVQFLAGGGASRAVVSFTGDPRQGQVEAGVVSYLEP
jgi:uncharacterized protein (TIGR02588 family)